MSSWAAVVKAAAGNSEKEKSLDICSENVKLAVVDATALIKGFTLTSMSDVIVTVQEVLDEIRDKQSRSWLQTLPYEIRTLHPEPESVKTVVRFARDTGDLQFLSNTDIKLIALTFQLEAALHGTDHLCPCPVIQRRATSGYSGKQSSLPGWGAVSNPADWEAIDRQNAIDFGMEGGHNEESRIRSVHPLNEIISGIEKLNPHDDDPESGNGLEKMTDSVIDVRQSNEDSITLEHVELEDAAGFQENQHLQGRRDNEKSEHFDDWIHVGQMQKKSRQHKIARHHDTDERTISEKSSRVCCLTSDFGIQNVLLQMGLNLVTPDGVRIRHLSKYGLKCASCSKVTQGKEKMFCPHCGNATLYKVRLEIGQNGMDIIGGLVSPSQRRGSKCRIPPSKGGKKNSDAILSEDVMHQAMSRYRNMKHDSVTDVFGPEFNEDSWFKSRAVRNQLKDQLPGRYGYPKGMGKYVPHRRKR